MASKTQDRLLEEFGGLFEGNTAGAPTVGGESDLTESLTEVVTQVAQAAAGNTGPIETSAPLMEGAAATPAGTNTRGGSTTSSESSSGPSAGSIASTFLESGFGIVPLITGLIGLFSGGPDAPPALQKYVMPSSIAFESADTGGGLSASDFDQTGAPRPYSTGGATSSGPGTSGAATPQITVNVQAMDAQSFMDYSGQIAQAVRGAMLNLSSLNDVVNEL